MGTKNTGLAPQHKHDDRIKEYIRNNQGVRIGRMSKDLNLSICSLESALMYMTDVYEDDEDRLYCK